MREDSNAAYVAEIERWRQQRDQELRAADGWLALAGLHLLTQGSHTIGSAAENAIRLPASAPAHLGEIRFQAGKALLVCHAGAPVLVDGALARTAELADNGNQRRPTPVTTGSVTFFIHKFGDQYAVRVKDSANPVLQSFSGRRWFAVKPEYRTPGRFTPFPATHEIAIETVVNTPTVYRSVGAVDFVLHGEPLRLLAAAGYNPGELFVVLRDATAGQETYPAARFLTVAVDGDGSADVDFNKACNPPCAFTPYATCPLPPPANVLPVRIEAGERYTQMN